MWTPLYGGNETFAPSSPCCPGVKISLRNYRHWLTSLSTFAPRRTHTRKLPPRVHGPVTLQCSTGWFALLTPSLTVTWRAQGQPEFSHSLCPWPRENNQVNTSARRFYSHKDTKHGTDQEQHTKQKTGTQARTHTDTHITDTPPVMLVTVISRR